MKKTVILIIDDDPAVRQVLADILEFKGYGTLVAKDGAEALSLMQANDIDLALIDLGLPDISGLDVLSRIKADHPSTAAIILTGNATLESAMDATSRGAFSYLQKPYDIDQLLLQIKRAIEKQQADLEHEKLNIQLLQAQKLESVGRLAAGIAHEINTPIQFISSNIAFLKEAFKESSHLITSLLELLESIKNGTVTEAQIKQNDDILAHLDWDYLQEEIPRAIDQSNDGLQRVASIVQAMKEFSHPGSKQKVNADLNQLIETTITISRNEWKYVATVDTDLDPELQPLPCLANEMGQVFLNLLVNAAHAIENQLGNNPEGNKGRITISTKQHDQHVEIRISDTGCGIPAHIHNKVFDPFFTTKDVGKGTGQGLTIAHDVIVGKHKGTLVFEAEPGSGTTFIIRLPRHQE
ncbi:MAG: response regulator [Proteobacteria bacterium]|nr:response regulator [Pseudomonadota bacterium]MBU1650204.1 response regulator [Pseudomonadota bacterium]